MCRFQNLKRIISRTGSGNKAFPEYNPQAEFISAEENRAFRACDGTHLFILLSFNSKS